VGGGLREVPGRRLGARAMQWVPSSDIPDALSEFSKQHPEVNARAANHLGASASLPGTILCVAGDK